MDDFELFFDSALSLLRRDPGAVIEWRELDEPHVAIAALCQAQGRLAVPAYALGELAIAAGACVRGDDFELALLPAALALGGEVAFHTGGRWWRAALAGVGPGDALDPGVLTARVARGASTVAAPPPELALARLGAAFDLLGTADALVAMAVGYAGDRRQFGRPIGTFQAVQHLLAESHVLREGLRSLCRAALDDLRLAEAAKAHAGSVARHVAQATLQVLGAIGFTMEHDHQRYYRRVMVLEASFGSSQMLLREIGQRAASGPIDRMIAIRR